MGSQIILLWNLDPPKLCSGTRLCVKKMLGNAIEATVLTGKGEGETVFIPWIPLIPADLPVRLAFAITINKSPDCIRKSISREKCGILAKGPKYVYSSLAVARQRVHNSYPRIPTMRNC
jgi:hypothetical protein